MGNFAVLLENYSELPFYDWGPELAKLLGIPEYDLRVKLRHQQGIVLENLSDEKAGHLIAYLKSKGHLAFSVPGDKVVKLDKPMISHAGKLSSDGIEFDDFEGNKFIFRTEEIALIQAGWVEEDIKPEEKPQSPIRLHVDRLGPRGMRLHEAAIFGRESNEPLGWVLNVFRNGYSPAWMRISGHEFNYGYQGKVEAGWEQHFRKLLTDIAGVVPENKLDYGFLCSIDKLSCPPKAAEYRTLSNMTERARWMLTLRIFKEEEPGV